jgi:general secretion pathway protein F
MLGFVVPQFEKLFTDMGDALPLPTRLVMELGHAFKNYGLVMGLWPGRGLGRDGAGCARRRAPVVADPVLRMPLLGRLMLKYELTLFSRSLGTLLGNGVPLLTALHIATDTVTNAVRRALADVAPRVKEGSKVVDAITATQMFEPLALNLIRVGRRQAASAP